MMLRLVLLALKHIYDEDGLQQATALFDLMEKLAMTESTAEFVATVLRYLVTGSSTITEANLRAAMEKQWPEGVVIMSTIAENWIQQGIQQGMKQGLQQGLQQGIVQGRREGLLDAINLGLKLRFGSAGLRLLPEIRRIDDPEMLQAIYEGIETVASPEELQSIYK